MSFYYIIYFLLIPLCIIDTKVIPKKNKIFVLYSLCIFYAFIGGYGNWDGTDWTQFYGVFKDARWDNIFTYTRYNDVLMEPGYMFLNILSKTLFGTYSNFLFLLNLAYLLVATKEVSKRTEHPIIAFTVFFFMRVQFLMLRQFVAITFLILSIKFIEKRKLWKYIITVLFACSMHSSAVIFFPMYWIPLIPLNYIASNLIYFCSIILSSVLRDYIAILGLLMGGNIQDKVAIYVQQDTKDNVLSMFTLIFCCFIINITLYIRNKMKDKAEVFKANIILWGYLIGISINMIFLGGFEELQRLSALFFIFTPLIWSYMLKLVFNKNKIVICCFFLFFVVYIIKKFGDLEFFENMSFYVPYRMSFK